MTYIPDEATTPNLYRAMVYSDSISHAYMLSAGAHFGTGQTRPTLTDPDVPYLVHPVEVAEIVAGVKGISDEAIVASLLHDVVEDTKLPLHFIIKLFGQRVGELVADLTDVYTPENYPDKNRAERKRLEAERLSYIDPEAKTIKLADGLSNTPSIAINRPSFMPVYGPEKRAVWHNLRAGGEGLWFRLDAELRKWGY